MKTESIVWSNHARKEKKKHRNSNNFANMTYIWELQECKNSILSLGLQ